MTQAPVSEGLVLRGPDALIAALPYLLGFHPRESLVMAWIRSGTLALTQRVDLPERPDESWCDAVWSHATATAADEVIVVAIGTGDGADAAAAAVLMRAALEGLVVRDCLRVVGSRWWSALCTNEQCCPEGGREIDESTALAVAAEMALDGRAPRDDRDALVAEFAANPAAAAEVAAAIRAAPAPGKGWRASAVNRIVTWLRDAEAIDPVSKAAVVAGLADTRVRDTVLWDLSQLDPGDLVMAMPRLAAAVQAAPEGAVAPVCTCAAIVAWLVGDGARALICLQRGLTDDPDYSLGLLVLRSLEVGLPPQSWRDSMRGISRKQCLR